MYTCVLVRSGEDDSAMRWFAGEDAAAFLFGAVVRDATDGGLGEFLDFLFGLGGAVPVAEEEAALFDFDEELVPGVNSAGISFAIVTTATEQVLLYLIHQLRHVVGNAFDRHGYFFQGIATAHFASAILKVARTDGETHGNALKLVLGELPAGLVLGTVIILDGETLGT